MGTVLNWGNPLHKPYLLFLLGFGVITVYIPGILGASISTGWLFLFIVAPILLLYCEIKLGFGFIFICYAALSLIWTEILNIAWFSLLKLIMLGCVFWIGQNIKDLTPIFKGLALGLGVSVLVTVANKLGFITDVYSLNSMAAGLFVNPNIYSEISAILFISLLIFKLWWWIPITLPGLILVQSRTAFVGLGAGLFILLWGYNKSYAIASTLVLFIIAAILYKGGFALPSIHERFDMWADTIQGIKILGNGVGSYEPLFPYYATHIDTELARPKYAHNDLLNIIFEFGIGSVLFLMVIFNVFKTKRLELVILITIFVISLFTYAIYVPVTAFIAFLVAGNISNYATYNGSVGFNSGSILFGWFKRKKLIKA